MLYTEDDVLTQCIDEETGEINIEKFLELEQENNAKIENVAIWIKSDEALADAIRTEEKSLAERRKKLENKIGKRKEFLKYILSGKKFRTARTDVSYRTSKNVVKIDDEKMISDDYKIKKETITISKTAIKDAILAGQSVNGAHLEDSTSIIIK